MPDTKTDFESARLAALQRLGLLDSEPEAGFDSITDLAVALTGARMAAISLVDRDRQWFKSNINLPADETPRDVAFCHHAIEGDDVFYIPNALEDDRFRDNPLVTGPPNIRGYAGVPLREPGGYKIGTLCVIHDQPIDFSEEDFERLRSLAQVAEGRVAERARAHANDASTRQLAAIAQVQSDYIADRADVRVAFGRLLDAALELTESEYGFIGEILTEDGQPFLKTHAITNIAWDADTQTFYDEHAVTGFEFRNLDTLFGYSIRTGKDLITNSPQEHEEAGGLPDGHPSLDAYMGLPLFSRGEFVAMIGIANREGGYDAEVKQAIEPLLVTITSMVNAHRAECARRKAIEELDEIRERYDLAVQGSSAGIWELDLRTDIAFFSSRLLEIAGQPRSAITEGGGYFPGGQQRIFDSVHPDDRDRVDAEFRVHLKDRTPYEQEYRLERLDGRFITVRSRGQAEWDKNGVPIRMAGSIEDISESIALERDKARANERLAAVTELGGIGSWEVDLESGTLEWDPITRQIHEVDDDFEPNMETAIEFYAPEARDEITRLVERGMESGEPWDSELPFITAKGNRIWVRAVGRAVFVDGELHKLVGSFQDVTERRQREEELRTLSSRLAIALDSSGVGVWEHELGTNTHWWDESTKRLFGYAADDATPDLEVWMAGIHADDRDAVQRHMDRALATRSRYASEYRYDCGDRGERHIRSQGYFRERLDGSTVITGVNVDITEDVRAALELDHQREEAERANAAKTQFLANMSHEIRTPLNGVMGMAQLLRLTALNDKQTSYVDTLQSSGQTLLDLIDDVLDISRIEAGQTEIKRGPFSLSRLIQAGIDTVTGPARQKALDLVVNADTDLPDWVIGDEKHTRQVLTNIVGNAVKFTSSGSVIVDVKRKGGDRVSFRVTDTGPGIPEAKQAQVFDRFAQVDDSSTREFGGSGLGLAICKELIHLAGGDLGLESEAGKGSSFWFELDLPETEPPVAAGLAGEADAVPAQDQEGGLILVVDDVPTNQVVAAALVRAAGHNVKLAGNGAEAIAALENQRFDAVLMDIQMPVMSGDEAIQRIRESGKPFAKIPIYAVTADATKGARERYENIGADGYLSKPLDLQGVATVLQKARAANG